tara:strand:- start:309 stop:1010 length:702 start_codon:yes stop_codon:yes gene_type:complete
MLGLGSGLAFSGVNNNSVLDTIAGLQVWLQNGVGVTAAKWNDSSGNGNHAVQTTEGDQGALEDGGIDFSGGNMDFTDKITLGSFTVFIALESNVEDSQSLIGNADGSDFIRINQTASNEFRSNRTGIGALIVSHSTDFTYEGEGSGVERFVMMFRQEDDNTVDIGVNADIDSFALSSSTGADMEFEHLGSQNAGKSNAFDGTIYEVAIYDSNLSASDATLVREDMASRAGITL